MLTYFLEYSNLYSWSYFYFSIIHFYELLLLLLFLLLIFNIEGCVCVCVCICMYVCRTGWMGHSADDVKYEGYWNVCAAIQMPMEGGDVPLYYAHLWLEKWLLLMLLLLLDSYLTYYTSWYLDNRALSSIFSCFSCSNSWCKVEFCKEILWIIDKTSKWI